MRFSRVNGLGALAFASGVLTLLSQTSLARAGAVDSWGPTDNTGPVALEPGQIAVDSRSNIALPGRGPDWPGLTVAFGLPGDIEIDAGTQLGSAGSAPTLGSLTLMASIQSPWRLGENLETGLALGGSLPVAAGGASSLGASVAAESEIASTVLDFNIGYRHDIGSGGAVYLNGAAQRELGAGFSIFGEAYSFIGATGGRGTDLTGHGGLLYRPIPQLSLDGSVAATVTVGQPAVNLSTNVGLIVYPNPS